MSKIFKFIAKTLLALFILTVLWVVIYRFVPVPGTPLMLIRKVSEGIPVKHTWVPIEKISPDMAIAVVASEDAHFMEQMPKRANDCAEQAP